MNVKKIVFVFLTLIRAATCMSGYAQVAISNNTVIPGNTVMLQVEAGSDQTNPRGFLMPRFNVAQETNILANNPAEGLAYYSTTKKKFVHFNGSSMLLLNPWNVNADLSRLTFNPAGDFRVGIGNDEPNATLDVTGTVAVTGDITLNNGNLNVSSGTISGFGTIPVGGIIMWSGGSVPAGWALCDGQNGTPDLRGRFIVGSGSRMKLTLDADGNTVAGENIAFTVSSVAGYDQVILNTNQLPSHSHTGQTEDDGQHWHEVPVDSNTGGYADLRSANDQLISSAEVFAWPSVHANDRAGTTLGGQHVHQFTTNTSGNGLAHENRPPYYVLAFIMRIQ